jgi:lactoylglutathione lyase
MKLTIPTTILACGLFVLALTGFTRQRTVSRGASINHIAVYVYDLKASADFYKNVIGLEEINEPFKDGKHVWLRIGDHANLHLISGNGKEQTHVHDNHIALTVPSLEKFAKILDEQNIKYGNWSGESKQMQVRPDGVKQVYLQDPDGNWLEINDDRF